MSHNDAAPVSAPDHVELHLRQQELAGRFGLFALGQDELQPVLDEACRVAAEGLGVGSDPALPPGKQPSRSVEQLTELIGRVSLKDLVRESTEVIERLAIEAALELTNDNRASAAEMLGLSRQSLYVKLRRYGIGDLTAASPA